MEHRTNIKSAVVKTDLRMHSGEGQNSYAENSLFQRSALTKAMPFLQEAIKQQLNSQLPNCFTIALLGCSSGPNSFLPISQIINTLYNMCKKKGRKLPDYYQVFLNDLPGNDFNSVLRAVPDFYDQLKNEKGDKLGQCFISGHPGSFYGRLFPSKSLHFVHSSSSLHWLSQVPEGIKSNNKRNIHMAKTSPPKVFEAYKEQYKRDFSLFLKMRSEEIVKGGSMLLTLLGRTLADPSMDDGSYSFQLLTNSLLDMAKQGLVKEIDIDSFNIPFYTPYKEELRMIIQEEGSFNLDILETFVLYWDGSDIDMENKELVYHMFKSGRGFDMCMRAVVESMVVSYFGSEIVDDLFGRYEKYVGEHLSMEKGKLFNIVVSLTKK